CPGRDRGGRDVPSPLTVVDDPGSPVGAAPLFVWRCGIKEDTYFSFFLHNLFLELFCRSKGDNGMIRWEKGRVEAVLEEREEVQRLRVRLERTGERGTAIHYPPLLGRAEVGDEVWLNVTAVHLSLGTGGNHFVAGWVKRPPRAAPIRGHIMKLRYTPWQIAL